MEMTPSLKLSTILITKNAAKTVEATLKSVRPISDEIIILDSGSTDDTVEICTKYSDLVQSTDWPGFGPQKARALALARGEWVLSIDADEVLTQDCQQAILQAIKREDAVGFKIKRLMIFAGSLIEHSGCSDAPLRLFKKSSSRFSEDIVHESVIVKGKVGSIDAPMLHYSYASIGDWIAKMNLYSELGAKAKVSRKKIQVRHAVLAACVSFFKMYVLKKGFLDGRFGFVASVNSAVASYYKYLKLALDHKFNFPAQLDKH